MKRLTILLTALLTAALCAAPALAANRVETLTTDVALRADGSAHVTQVFSADTAEGTEFYVDRMDSGCLTYSRFAVSDENGSYAVLPDGQWDIDASFDEKAGKCGLLEIDGGVELCWGITEYGGPAAVFGHAGQSGTGNGRPGPDLLAAFAGASRRGCL